jgi:intracellular sulfur oxidation DsrE/DsrF family protein
MRRAVAVVVMLVSLVAALAAVAQQRPSDSGWQNPVIKDAGGAVSLPNAAVQPDKNKQYRVLVDITKGSDDPKEVLEGLDHAARVINVMSMSGVPLKNIHMALVFHGPATTTAVMNDDVYRAKYKVENPNAKVIHELKEAGAEVFVCGQALHAFHYDAKDVLPDVKVATAAVVVLVVYQNNGYALMPF